MGIRRGDREGAGVFRCHACHVVLETEQVRQPAVAGGALWHPVKRGAGSRPCGPVKARGGVAADAATAVAG